MVEVMTKQDKIEVLRDWVSKNSITHYKNLADACKQHGLEPYEDILSPMEWNSCDRCGALDESDGGFLWVEGFDWNEDDPKERALANYIGEMWEQGEYWSALCWECVKELKEKNNGRI